jgi:hypothetical protein
LTEYQYLPLLTKSTDFGIPKVDRIAGYEFTSAHRDCRSGKAQYKVEGHGRSRRRARDGGMADEQLIWLGMERGTEKSTQPFMRDVFLLARS